MLRKTLFSENHNLCPHTPVKPLYCTRQHESQLPPSCVMPLSKHSDYWLSTQTREGTYNSRRRTLKQKKTTKHNISQLVWRAAYVFLLCLIGLSIAQQMISKRTEHFSIGMWCQQDTLLGCTVANNSISSLDLISLASLYRAIMCCFLKQGASRTVFNSTIRTVS